MNYARLIESVKRHDFDIMAGNPARQRRPPNQRTRKEVAVALNNPTRYLSKSEFREIFSWDEATARLLWKVKIARKIVVGSKAGRVRPDGYGGVKVKGHDYLLHRVVWIYHNGDIPDGIQIDHINGDRFDNRPENLRLATPCEQQRNRRRSKNNTSGITGVYRLHNASDWLVQIKVNRKSIRIGQYRTMEEAVVARKFAEQRYGFHENHGRS